MNTIAASEDAAEGTMTPGRLLLVILLAFVGFNAAVLALPHDPYIRYQQMADTIQFRLLWDYERLHFDKTPIDVAVIGNSRLTAGVSGPDVSRRLGERLGHPVHVVNISLPEEGENAHYVVAKQLLKDHPEVQLIILSAIEQMPRQGHSTFSSIADVGDVLSAPVVGNGGYFKDVAALPYRQMMLFVKTLAPGHFGMHRAFDPALYFGTGFDTTRDKRADTDTEQQLATPAHRQALGEQASERLAEITPPLLPASMAGLEFGMTRSYVERTVARAGRNATRVAFLYQPIYSNLGPVRDLDFYTRIGPVFRSDFLATHPEYYHDYAHLSVHGAQLESEWLGDRIADAVKAGQLHIEKRQ